MFNCESLLICHGTKREREREPTTHKYTVRKKALQHLQAVEKRENTLTNVSLLLRQKSHLVRAYVVSSPDSHALMGVVWGRDYVFINPFRTENRGRGHKPLRARPLHSCAERMIRKWAFPHSYFACEPHKTADKSLAQRQLTQLLSELL